MIDRNKMVQHALQIVDTVKYDEVDCINFVKLCAKAAGQSFVSSGTNYTWRYGLEKKGDTLHFALMPGDVLFRSHKPGEAGYALPARYNNSAETRDIYHIGIYCGMANGKYVVCHSSGHINNGVKATYTTLSALAKYWDLAGTLRYTSPIETLVQQTVTSQAPARIVAPDALYEIQVLVDKLNFRKGPGKSYARLDYLFTGDKVKIIKEINSIWGYGTFNGRTGYVQMLPNYVKKLG